MQHLGENALSVMTEHWSTWVTEADIESAHQAGINHLRIPVGYWAFLDNTENEPYLFKSGQLQFLEDCLGWAYKRGMYAIIDLVRSWTSGCSLRKSGLTRLSCSLPHSTACPVRRMVRHPTSRLRLPYQPAGDCADKAPFCFYQARSQVVTAPPTLPSSAQLSKQGAMRLLMRLWPGSQPARTALLSRHSSWPTSRAHTRTTSSPLFALTTSAATRRLASLRHPSQCSSTMGACGACYCCG